MSLDGEEWDETESGTAVQRLFPATKPFDGSAAVRAPEVFEEYTAHPQLYSCKAAHRMCCDAKTLWLWQDSCDTFYA